MKRIVILACGTKGDVLHLLELASALQHRGNPVWVLADQQYQADCQRLGLMAEFLDAEKDGDRLLEDLPDLDSASGIVRFLEKHIIPRLLRARSILEKASAREPLHLVALAFFGMVSLVAEKVGATLTTVFGAPDHLYRWENSLQFLVAGMSRKLNSLCDDLGIPAVNSAADLARYPQQRLAFWPDWFDLEPHTGKEVQRTGFILPATKGPSELPPEIRHFLEDSTKAVLITGSTARSANARRFYEQAIASCDALGKKAIVVARHRDLLPESLSSGTTWVPWVSPIGSVLPHMAAVIHHGGIGTTGESTRAGTPQLVLADGLDRPTNGRSVQRLGAGRVLLPVQWTAQQVTETLSGVMNSPDIQRRSQELSKMVRSTDSLGVACGLVEKSAGVESTANIGHSLTSETLASSL
jgi:rhamnosyltransferase subunit B